MHIFPGRLKSKWIGPFLITKVFPNREVKLENKEDIKFTVIGIRRKVYVGHAESVDEVVEAYHLDKL